MNKFLLLASIAFAVGSVLPGIAQDSRPQLVSREGGGVTWKNTAELKAAAAAGNPLACAQLGEQLLRGDDRVARDVPQALELLEKAARAGIPSAAFRLGMLLDDGEGVAQDRARALEYFRSAAAGDFAEAYHNVGAAYAGAHGVKRDYVEALAWLILATARGVGAASEQAVRAQILKVNHPEWIAEGEKRAVEIEREFVGKTPASFLPPPAPFIYGGSASTSPNASAPGKISAPSATERGTVTVAFDPPAIPKALAPPPIDAPPPAEIKITTLFGAVLRWRSLTELRRAADRGEAPALFALGEVLLEGEFAAPSNAAQAVALLERGAAAGSIDAAQLLADVYTKGDAVTADAAKAFQYNLQAARGGSLKAITNTGALFANGTGTTRNFTESLAWLIVAKQRGVDVGSESRIRDYLGRSAPAQIAIAEKRAIDLEREIAAARAAAR